MSRGLWFVVGAGAGVYATNRARRLAESLTADGLRSRLQGVTHGARLFGEEVRSGQQEKESELRERLGLVPSRPPGLRAAPAGGELVEQAPGEVASLPHRTDADPARHPSPPSDRRHHTDGHR